MTPKQRQKILSRCNKLLDMLRMGEPGERDNAKLLLDELMARHGIKPEELEADIVRTFTFEVPKHLHWLFTQVACSLLGMVTAKVVENAPDSLQLDCAEDDHILILTKFNWYADAWRQEMELLTEAFFYAQDLWPADALKYAPRQKAAPDHGVHTPGAAQPDTAPTADTEDVDAHQRERGQWVETPQDQLAQAQERNMNMQRVAHIAQGMRVAKFRMPLG